MTASRTLDRRMRGALRESGLLGVPEVRRMMRLAWLNGFTFGALERQLSQARQEAIEAIARHGSPS